MGYRSDIRIILKKEDFEELKRQFKERFEEHNWLENFEVCKEETRTDYSSNEKKDVKLVYFGWNLLKWYKGEFKDVSFIEDFVKEHEGSFARIGEDFDDFEEFGECCGWYASETFIRKFDDNAF